MKKAKRLLAVLLAAIMMFSAAVVPGYAYNATSDNYQAPGETKGKYWFSYEQAAAYLLDLLDNLLAGANITMNVDELNDMANIGVNIFTSNIMINLDKFLAEADSYDASGREAINLTSVDKLIKSLDGIFRCLEDGGLVKIADALTLLGDLLDGTNGLNRGGLDPTVRREFNTVSDVAVLEMLVNWVCNQKNLFRAVVGGTFNWGSLLEGLIGDLITDFLPGATLDNLGVGIKNLLYQMLVDDTATAIPDGQTIDDGVQQLIDWMLIEGTGTSAATGAASMLGENAEPMMPAIADQPGGASLYGISIEADRDGDGATETHTMSFYQLVNNLLQALLDGMLGDLLYDLLLDLAGAEVTEEFPYGDPAIMSDVMFNTIVGAVEGLMVANGAPAITYTEHENTYPIPKIEKLIDWFLMPGGGLETLLVIDFYGIHIQDALMSLLNDVGRLAINLLPGLGLFADSAHLAYTADELNEVYYYTSDKQVVSDPATEGIVDQLYLTYETEELVYPASKSTNAEGATVIDSYNYFATDLPVNTTDTDASAYMDPDFIRPYYVISTDSVFACIIKMALNDMIDGCYFPEWTTDIPSVLAYGLAGLAVPVLPENDYYARLDAYHEMLEGGTSTVDENGEEIEPLYYYVDKVYNGTQVRVPKAALDIISSYLAVTLNAALLIKDTKDELDTDTTFEKFMGQFLLWGFTNYFPALTGRLDPDAGDDFIADTAGETRTWTADVNTFVDAVYSDYSARTISSTANWDAIYELIDSTLFTLLPESWLPNLNGSFELINGTLLGNLIEFDLQGILDILSVNTDPNGELHQPVMTVVLRIIDRVLAAVFNDKGVLLPANRSNVVVDSNLTTITTLDALLSTQVDGAASESSSLAMFLYNLLVYLQAYGIRGDRNAEAALLAVALPLIASSEYERPADSVLTDKGILTYKVQDLEDYIDMFEDNVNAELYLSDLTEERAKILTDGTSKVVRSTDGTVYELQLSDGTVYQTFDDYTEANTLRKTLNDCYIVSELVDEKTETYTYHLYKERHYLTTATGTDTTDDAGVVTTYSDFSFATMADRAPFVSYDADYRFFKFEDFTNGYSYENAKGAIEDGAEFASSYRDFAKNDLPDAYKAWIIYHLESRLYNADLYDKNGDGYCVQSTTDTDYVAPTTDSTTGEVTDPGIPVDGYPSMPTAMLPLVMSTSTAFKFYDAVLGAGPNQQYTTVYMGGTNENALTAANFEQLQLAAEYAADADNDRTFSVMETEMIVRIALNSIDFDITADADGNYTGTKNWSNLTDAERTTISDFCAGYGFTLTTETLEDGTVQDIIKHKAFADIYDNLTLIDGVSVVPVDYATRQTLGNTKERTEAQDLQIQIYTSYELYAKTLYSNRRSLYNAIDYIGYRHELAEDDRARRLDVTMLNWVLAHTNHAYVNSTTNKRNFKLGTGIDASTGLPIEVKVYTSSSYENFRKAYDYGQALTNAASAATLGAGFTQGQVTEAFYGILETYQDLIDYLGAADKTQLISFIVIADAIIADDYTYDETYGVEEEGLNNLIKILAEAKTMRDDDSYDAERQGEVDVMAATLNQAIGLLVYKTAPTILPSDVTTGNGNTVNILQTSNVNNRIVGQVFGLEEGVGAVMDLVELVGMTLDSNVGNTVTITPSGRGMGTGAYYSGRVNNAEKFRYFAVVYGDLNGDARVDGTDASYLEYYMAIESANSSDMGSAVYEAADANHDGMVDAGDVSEIVNHYTFRGEIDQLSHSTSETTL